jgi:hypothetical protein
LAGAQSRPPSFANETSHAAPATGGATAAAQSQPGEYSRPDLNWIELPERKAMKFALLSGDPKTGAYTQIRKVPAAGTDNPPHSHSSELKNMIISGVWHTGAGGTNWLNSFQDAKNHIIGDKPFRARAAAQIFLGKIRLDAVCPSVLTCYRLLKNSRRADVCASRDSLSHVTRACSRTRRGEV